MKKSEFTGDRSGKFLATSIQTRNNAKERVEDGHESESEPAQLVQNRGNCAISSQFEVHGKKKKKKRFTFGIETNGTKETKTHGDAGSYLLCV